MRLPVQLAAALLAIAALAPLCIASTEFKTNGWIVRSDGSSGSLTTHPDLPAANVHGVSLRSVTKGATVAGVYTYYISGIAANSTAVDPGLPSQSSERQLSQLYVAKLTSGDSTEVVSYHFHPSTIFGPRYVYGFDATTSVKVAYREADNALYLVGTLVGDAGSDSFALRLSSTDLGQVKWARPLREYIGGDPSYSWGSALSVSTAGAGVYVGGVYIGNRGDEDGFALGLQPYDGRVEWSQDGFTTTHNDRIATSSVTPAGDVVTFGGCSMGWISADNPSRKSEFCDGAAIGFRTTDGSPVSGYAFDLGVTVMNVIEGLQVYGDSSYGVGWIKNSRGQTNLFLSRVPLGSADAIYTSILQPLNAATEAISDVWGYGLHVDETSIYVVASSNAQLVNTVSFQGQMETSVMMFERTAGVLRWVRHGGVKGVSQGAGITCWDDQCISVGSSQPLLHNNTLLEIVRTSLCTNGSHIADTSVSQLTTHDTCYLCSAGTFQDVAGHTSCKECLSGTYAPTTGMGSCLPCPVGYFAPNNRSSACTVAPLGGYVPELGQANYTLCPPGSYADVTGLSACKQCPPGTANSVTGALSSSACVACEPGMYSNYAGASSCSPCPAGQWQSAANSSACRECLSGTASAVTGATNGTVCQSCLRGTFAPKNGTSECSKCPPGTYLNSTGSIGPCEPCPAGSFASGEGNYKCALCLPGSASASPGESSCVLCPRGEYQDGEGMTSCLDCDEDKYAGRQGSSSCTKCPDNSESPKRAQHLQSCLCKNGMFGNPATGRECRPCPNGAECVPGDRWPRVGKGQWMFTGDAFVTQSCVPLIACPGGEPHNLPPVVSSFEDDPDEQNTTSVVRLDMNVMSTSTGYTSPCEAGYIGEACSVCDTNYYRTKGKCVECRSVTLPTEWIITVTFALGLLAAIGLLALGLTRGTMVAIRRRHRARVARNAGTDDFISESELKQLEAYRAAVFGTRRDSVADSGDGIVEESSGSSLVESEKDDNLSAPPEVLRQVSSESVRSNRHLIDSENPPDSEGSERAGMLEDEDENTGFWKKWRIVRLIMGIVRLFKRAKQRVARSLEFSYTIQDRAVVLELESRPLSARLGSVIAEVVKFCQLWSVLLNINVEWPQSLQQIGASLQLISLDISELLSVQCATESSAETVYRDRYFTRIFVPLIFVGLCFLGAALSFVAEKAISLSKRAVKGKRKEVRDDALSGSLLEDALNASVDHFIMLGLVVCIIAYVTLHAAVVEIFTCTHRAEGRYYLVVEASVRCFDMTGVWGQMLPISVIGVVFFSFGIPLMLAVFIFSKHRFQHQPKINTRYRVLWSSYKEKLYAWELVVTLFKAILVFSLPLSLSSAGDQLTCLLFLTILMLLLQLLYLPYLVPSDNAMDILVLVSVVFLVISGIIFDMSSSTSEGLTDIGRISLESFALLFMGLVLSYFAYTLFGGHALNIRLRLWIRRLNGENAEVQDFYEFIATLLGTNVDMSAAGAVVSMPDGVHVLGCPHMGSKLYVPAAFVKAWAHVKSKLDYGAREVTVIGRPGGGKTSFAAYLHAMLMEQSGLSEDMEPVVYYIRHDGKIMCTNLVTGIVNRLPRLPRSIRDIEGNIRPVLISEVPIDTAGLREAACTVIRLVNATELPLDTLVSDGAAYVALEDWSMHDLLGLTEARGGDRDAELSVLRFAAYGGRWPGAIVSTHASRWNDVKNRTLEAVNRVREVAGSGEAISVEGLLKEAAEVISIHHSGDGNGVGLAIASPLALSLLSRGSGGEEDANVLEAMLATLPWNLPASIQVMSFVTPKWLLSNEYLAFLTRRDNPIANAGPSRAYTMKRLISFKEREGTQSDKAPPRMLNLKFTSTREVPLSTLESMSEGVSLRSGVLYHLYDGHGCGTEDVESGAAFVSSSAGRPLCFWFSKGGNPPGPSVVISLVLVLRPQGGCSGHFNQDVDHILSAVTASCPEARGGAATPPGMTGNTILKRMRSVVAKTQKNLPPPDQSSSAQYERALTSSPSLSRQISSDRESVTSSKSGPNRVHVHVYHVAHSRWANERLLQQKLPTQQLRSDVTVEHRLLVKPTYPSDPFQSDE